MGYAGQSSVNTPRDAAGAVTTIGHYSATDLRKRSTLDHATAAAMLAGSAAIAVFLGLDLDAVNQLKEMSPCSANVFWKHERLAFPRNRRCA